MCIYLFVKYGQGRLLAATLLALVTTCTEMHEAQPCVLCRVLWRVGGETAVPCRNGNPILACGATCMLHQGK